MQVCLKFWRIARVELILSQRSSYIEIHFTKRYIKESLLASQNTISRTADEFNKPHLILVGIR